MILGRLLVNMQLRFEALCLAATTMFEIYENIRIYCFCAQIELIFSLELRHCEGQRVNTFLHHHGGLQDAFSKNISFGDPQKGSHFSCGKLVSHEGTSTV